MKNKSFSLIILIFLLLGLIIFLILMKNQPPRIISLTADPSIVSMGESSTITCIASDPEGDTLNYTWTKSEGTISGKGSQVIWNSPSVSGTYIVTCTVIDKKGGTYSTNIKLVVNQPPRIISLTADPSIVSMGESSTITCIASDPEGDTLNYTWTKSEGTISGKGSQVIWNSPYDIGKYTITCTVYDNKNTADSKKKFITSAKVVVQVKKKYYGPSTVVPFDDLYRSDREIFPRELIITDGRFKYPCGIVVSSSDHVYVADTYNHRIQKFDAKGKFITKWGTEGTKDGQFINPYGLAIDASGNVYVADYGNHRIQKFDAKGKFITKWG
ncbi:MAG: SMP-30/gluconolactonase/LRE family protein, partial [bacterium]|nr:SMP-30/gluconolactonase/LRE family protein [bacterium]